MCEELIASVNICCIFVGMWYIYTLENPINNRIFYVGSTQNVRNRFSVHIGRKNNQHRMNLAYHDILKEIHEYGTIPIMRVLEKVSNKKDSLVREKYWITSFKEAGENLSNHNSMGYNTIHKNKRLSSDNKIKLPDPLKYFIQKLFKHSDGVKLSSITGYTRQQVLHSKRTGLYPNDLLKAILKYYKLRYDEIRQEYTCSESL